MTTAEVAIVVSGAVAIGTTGFTAFFQWLREKSAAARERTGKDLDELRSLLDELTAAMHRHTTQLIALEHYLDLRDMTPGGARGKVPSVHPTQRILYTLHARLVIRLGRGHWLVKRFDEYLDLTNGAMGEIDTLFKSGEPFAYEDVQLQERARSYWRAFGTFVDGSQALVGSQVS